MAAAAAATTESSCHDNGTDSDSHCCQCRRKGYYLKMVSCGHVFCKACLEPNTVSQTQQNLVCPQCHVFGVSVWNAQGAASPGVINELSISLGGEFAISMQGRQDETVHCQTCGMEVRSGHSFFCVQCKVILCSDNLCLGDHTIKRHYLVLQMCPTKKPTPDDDTCSEHGLTLQHYCISCKKPVCASCSKSDKHRRHKVEGLSQSAERGRAHLKMAKECLEPAISYLEWFYRDLKKAGKDISLERERAQKAIHARAEEARRLIDEMEEKAVRSLVNLTSKLEKEREKDEIRVNDRLCALRAKRDHLTSSIANGPDTKLVHMDSNAQDIIQKPSVLKQFTSKLPEHAQFPQDHHDSTSVSLSSAIQKYVGSPHVQRRRRKVPMINVKFEFPVASTGSSQIHSWRICSGGRDQLVWVSSCSLRPSHPEVSVQLVDMSTFTVHDQQELKDLAGVRVDLVNANQHSALVSGRHQFLQLMKGDTELLAQKHSAPFTVFCKGRLRACLRFSGYRHEILPSVKALDDLRGSVESFDIARNGTPVSVDCSDSGQLFAVVNTSHQLSLYRRGEASPYCTYPTTSANGSCRILDACFFKIENHEVLLVADENENDVIALDVHRGCRLVGTLTNRSGELFHPVALNVDPYTGDLLVLCSPGITAGQAHLAVCSPTGVPLESLLGQFLGIFARTGR